MNVNREIYKQLLHVGFTVLRQAIDSGDRAWVNAEMELLHNIPSLIDEPNLERHHYFWMQEVPHYVGWIEGHGSAHAQSRMRTCYDPVWETTLAQASKT